MQREESPEAGRTAAPTTAYCTILARNYLPKAMTLADSLRRHHPGASLVILLIDAETDAGLPSAPGVRLVGTDVLGLERREVLRLATIYDLVEFATAVKPLLLKRLLEDHDQAAYLDPDTYVTSPMAELPVDLAESEGGILLTPHFLEPVGPGAELTEGHLLTVGVFNLGFCAVDRRARTFLDWWWGHLVEECRWDPLSGLFVDQKWVDIGSTLFHGTAWQHSGYNVSVANLHEREVVVDEEGYRIASTGDRLRLFHFHAFDSSAPDELTTRLDRSTAHLRRSNEALETLCADYAKELIPHEQALLPAPAYCYWTDTRGRGLSRHLRRAYRLESQGGTVPLPSPFLAEDATGWDRWRRRSYRHQARDLVGEAVKSVRLIFPEEYDRVKKRFPKAAGVLRSRTLRKGGIWADPDA